jgi:prepilin peptidase CpaA
MELTPPLIVALVASGVATMTDWREGKIYNKLTFPMMLVGLILNTALGDWRVGVFGLVAATALHWTLWRIGVQKAGDAKLLMAVGALMGPRFMLEASAWYAVLYVPVGLALLWSKGRLGNLVAAMRYTAEKAQGKPVGEKPEPTMMIAGPIIATGVVLATLV